MPLQVPSNRRYLVSYGAIGAAAIGFSYQCLRFWNTTSSRVNPNLELPSSSNSNGPQMAEKRKFLEYLENLGELIAKLGLKRKTDIPADFPAHNEVLLCRLALDGIGIDEQFKPQYTLIGNFNKQDLTRFEEETYRWRRFLKSLFKFKSQKEEEILFPDLELKKAEELQRMARIKAKDGGMYEYLEQLNLHRRMAKLVNLLVIQSELEPDSAHPLIEQYPRLLINVIDRLRLKNEAVTVAALKCLANTVHCSPNSAELVAKSDWLPLLASMIVDPVYDEERVLAHKILINTLNALGAEPVSLGPHLYEMHRPKGSEKPKMDIIFVHGLRGGAFRTWRQRDLPPPEKTTLFWPKDWLAKEIREPVRMIALDYSSAFFRLLASMDTLETRSLRFQKELQKAGVGQRPLLFICHSMGGLLAKRILMDNQQFLDKTVGILFVATPHRGSPVASQLAYDFLRPSEDVQLLRTESELNKELNERFATESKQIPLIWTVLECEKTPIVVGGMSMNVMMVPIESGLFGRGVVYHLNEEHHHLCKPVDTSSPFYGIIRNFVSDSLNHTSMDRKNNT